MKILSQYRWLAFGGGAIFVVILGFGSAIYLSHPGTVEPTPLVAGHIIAECSWDGHPSAWVDANSNGRRDSGEGPLQGVRFELLDVGRVKRLGKVVISDASGTAMFHQDLWGCPAIDLALHAIAPPGYHSTTIATVPVEHELSYGFANDR